HLARFLRAARDHGNVVMQRLQTWNEMATNQARTAGEQDLHTTSRFTPAAASLTSWRRSRRSAGREVYRSPLQHKCTSGVRVRCRTHLALIFPVAQNGCSQRTG